MLDNDDARWAQILGGYRMPYDPRGAVKILSIRPDDPGAWDELWQELHHQGDLGEASYVGVALLALAAPRWGSRPWHLYAIAATIEVERRRAGNPEIPAWLGEDYADALRTLRTLAASDLAAGEDPLLVRAASSFVAVASGDHKLGALLVALDQSELDEWLNERLNYAESYRQR